MKRALVIVALVAAALVPVALIPTPAAAAPAEQPCQPGAITQFDMAGEYYSADYGTDMYVALYGCGGVYIRWVNAWGTHEAGYITARHFPDGVVATRLPEFGPGLDGGDAVGIKAAERGFVQVLTLDPDDREMNVYRLRKIS